MTNIVEEIWRDVVGYKGYYQVSSFSRIKSLARVTHSIGRNQICSYTTITKTNEKILTKVKATNKYWVVTLYKEGKRKMFYTHNLIADAFMGVSKNLVTDHINNDRSDDRLCNLQRVTKRYNKSKDVKNKSSKFTGVSFQTKSQKWMAQIGINGKNKFLGYFKVEELAADAYQKALYDLQVPAI